VAVEAMAEGVVATAAAEEVVEGVQGATVAKSPSAGGFVSQGPMEAAPMEAAEVLVTLVAHQVVSSAETGAEVVSSAETGAAKDLVAAMVAPSVEAEAMPAAGVGEQVVAAAMAATAGDQQVATAAMSEVLAARRAVEAMALLEH